jgi:hypothetical protein
MLVFGFGAGDTTFSSETGGVDSFLGEAFSKSVGEECSVRSRSRSRLLSENMTAAAAAAMAGSAAK